MQRDEHEKRNERPLQPNALRTSKPKKREERHSAARTKALSPQSSLKQVERRQRRVRLQRRKKWLPFLFGLLILSILVALFLTHAPFFRIQSVRVEGNTVLTDREVMNALGDVDSNIFTFPTKRWEERLHSLEGIEEVEFSRELPNRLVVRIKENFVLGVFESAGRPYYVDEQGKITDRFVPEKNRIKPIALEKEVEKIGIGENYFSDARQLAFLSTLQSTQLVEGVTKVRFEKSQGIVIMYNDIVIRFGEPNDIIHKLTDLAAVLREIENKGVKAQEIILNEGQNPIVVTGNGRQTTPGATEPKKGTEGN
ncbi:cell division protein FtsQ/DivIB [Murdochiella vaginalis]|uniref:cell division protein FtsQ/DivIB n=1 Tax=Murdochiella vaginalis TaxID=1852373 RepID=UPI0008FE7307|nr:FtsQ-type POTRA domain-containing protein [Murdochiella vaginalis]